MRKRLHFNLRRQNKYRYAVKLALDDHCNKASLPSAAQVRGLTKRVPAQEPGSRANDVVGCTRAEVQLRHVADLLREQPIRFRSPPCKVSPEVT